MKIDVRKTAVCVLALLIALTLVMIFGNSSKTQSESKDQSDQVGEVIRPVIDPNKNMTDDEFSFLVRKSGHFAEYALLGLECAILAFLIKLKPTVSGAIYSAGGCLLAADVDEYIQSLVGRGSMVSDVFIDLGGALAGIALGFAASALAVAIVKKIKNKKA